jgi:hypothetical protein
MPLGDILQPSNESLLLVVTASYRMVSLGVYRMIQHQGQMSIRDIFSTFKRITFACGNCQLPDGLTWGVLDDPTSRSKCQLGTFSTFKRITFAGGNCLLPDGLTNGVPDDPDSGLMSIGDIVPPSNESVLLVVTASYRMFSIKVYRMIQSYNLGHFSTFKIITFASGNCQYRMVSLRVYRMIQTQGLMPLWDFLTFKRIMFAGGN